MPLEGVLLGEAEPLPFLRQDMHQDSAPHAPHTAERIHQSIEVMPLHGADIPEPHLLEQHARHEDVLHALVELVGQVLHGVPQR